MKKKSASEFPPPRPRKHGRLWQSYLFYDAMTRQLVRHKNRIEAIKAGRSDLDLDREVLFQGWIEANKKNAYLFMTEEAGKLGNIWTWVTSIKGLGQGGMAACLLAQIDDIGLFDNISKLWRFAGLAVIDGHAERNVPGEKSHKNNTLRAVCFLIGDQFIKQQTSPYVDVYYEYKARLREQHPEKIVRLDKNGKPARNSDGKIIYDYSDGHLHNMAMRKMVKIFLQHVWLKWREYEGLPITKPYAHDILGHSDLIPPPE